MQNKAYRLRWIAAILYMTGGLALLYCVLTWGQARYVEANGNWALEHPAALGTNESSVAAESHEEGDLVGRIKIPRLDFSAVVLEGVSDRTLARAIGHMKGSAAPGEQGNVVLAGHRDTFFRELRHIREGDEISVEDFKGPHQYRVKSTMIVDPEQTDVIAQGHDSTLTLITCYPFYFVGSAPKRFIVKADKLAD